MHCFPSLHFCLELPLFSACRKGMERLAVAFAIAMGVGHNSFLHVPPGSGPGTGMQPAWGCALFWVCNGCSANRLGGKKVSLMVHYYYSSYCKAAWKQGTVMAGGSDQGQNDQKQCLDAHFLPKSQLECLHKGKPPVCLHSWPKYRVTERIISCRMGCLLSKCLHSIHARAG